MATVEATQGNRVAPPRVSDLGIPPEVFVAEVRTTAWLEALASFSETIYGLTAGVLAIIGLAMFGGVMPLYMAAIGVLVIAGALLFQGAIALVRFSKLVQETDASRWEAATIRGSAWTQLIGGVTGITLGILSLVGLLPAVLLPVAIIVYGFALAVSSDMPVRLSHLQRAAQEGRKSFFNWRFTANLAASVQVLAGLSAMVLGILALIGIVPMVLVLVGLLALGCSALITGGILGSEMVMVYYGAKA